MNENDPLTAFVRRGQAAQAAVDSLLSTHLATADARAAYDLFSTMRTDELRDLLAAHQLDSKAATTPEAIAFGAGRQALITAVLKTRAKSPPLDARAHLGDGDSAAREAAPPASIDEDLLAAMVRELDTREAPITLVLRPLSALHLAGLLQLALRHPGTSTSEAHRRIAVTFIEHVRAYFADAPAVLEVLRRGDDPANDA
jgi:hypothetical protein